MKDDFAENLAFLCSYQPSIAAVCRKLGFNRQQFNKYLGGQARPSRHNMRRICDFFGVTESEMHLDAEKFEELVGLRRKPVQEAQITGALRHLDTLRRHSQNLDKYVGYYFRYFFSFGNSGLIIRSLAQIVETDGQYYWKNIEIMRDPISGQQTGINKYEGAVFYLADRIYIMEYETLEVNSITEMTLYPSHRSRVDRLLGIQTGGPTRRGRKPGASKAALEFIGKDIDIKAALYQCGLFRPDDRRIRPDLVDLIRNTINDGDFVLDVEEP